MTMPLDPSGVPDSVTPADSPSNPAGYAQVAPSGAGPAPYGIQAPLDDFTQLAADAMALSGPGGPRQSATDGLLSSPQGFSAGSGTSGYDIQQGWSGSGGDGWPAVVQPAQQDGFVAPGDYPGTT